MNNDNNATTLYKITIIRYITWQKEPKLDLDREEIKLTCKNNLEDMLTELEKELIKRKWKKEYADIYGKTFAKVKDGSFYNTAKENKVDLKNIPPHPYAQTQHRTGGNNVYSTEKFIHLIDGRSGRLDEATQDGDAFVTWDDGTYGEIKWNNIIKEYIKK